MSKFGVVTPRRSELEPRLRHGGVGCRKEKSRLHDRDANHGVNEEHGGAWQAQRTLKTESTGRISTGFCSCLRREADRGLRRNSGGRG